MLRKIGGSGVGGETARATAAGVPGKQSLTERLAGEATAGTAGALPHQQAIQRAFGAHDVSNIRAHTDGAAAGGTAAMGAEAFAHGDRVAFAGQPDLFTAAHEAAHVVQQRGGVSRGDASERHADEVAERVVQGRPAGDLLDAVASSRATAPAAPVVQHRLRQVPGMQGYYDDDRAYGYCFFHVGGQAFLSMHDDQRYTYIGATDQFLAGDGRYLDPARHVLLTAFGSYYSDGAQLYSYVDRRYIPALQLGAPQHGGFGMPGQQSASSSPQVQGPSAPSPFGVATPKPQAPAMPQAHASGTGTPDITFAFAPVPVAVPPGPLAMPPGPLAMGPPKPPAQDPGASPTAPSLLPVLAASPSPSGPGGPLTHTPRRSRSGKAGKSTHFSSKPPPRVTGAGALGTYDGGSPGPFKRIMKKTERSGLPDSLTRALVKRASERIAAGESVTPEARELVDMAAPSLSAAGAQRNHTQAVENVNRFYAGVMAILLDHTRGLADRNKARDNALRVARALTGDDATIVAQVQAILDDVDSDDDSDDAADKASRMGRITADHRHNMDLGHGGRNMGMSNRPDVTTSPGRTHMTEQDADILDGIDEPFRETLGEDLGTAMLEVPMSPGGTHIMSSKTLEPPGSGGSGTSH